MIGVSEDLFFRIHHRHETHVEALGPICCARQRSTHLEALEAGDYAYHGFAEGLHLRNLSICDARLELEKHCLP